MRLHSCSAEGLRSNRAYSRAADVVFWELTVISVPLFSFQQFFLSPFSLLSFLS